MRLAPVLFAVACGPGLAIPVARIDAPAELASTVRPSIPSQLIVPVTNHGTAEARVTLAIDAPARAVSTQLRVPAGATAPAVFEIVLEGYDDIELTAELSAGDQRLATVVEVTADRDADDDGHDAAAAGGDDCDDDDPTVHPGRVDDCDGRDDDCDTTTDEDAAWFEVWPDADDDGFGRGASDLVCRATLGLAEVDGDCDDADPDVNPAAAEIWYDGIDQDCDGASDDDQDGDGVDIPLDCDDLSADAAPGMPELDNGRDDDCDGWFDEDFVVEGDLVFTEIFVEPTTAAGRGEWVELANLGGTHTPLADLQVVVDGVASGLPDRLLAPLEVVVLCADDDLAENGGVVCDAVIDLPTGARTFTLEGAGLIDAVNATGWPFVAGRALELGQSQLSASANDVVDAWCPAVSTFGDRAGDRGTPGLVVPPC